MTKKFNASEWESPQATSLKYKDVAGGLSITKKGRLVFTIKLQEEMGAQPKDRSVPIYVKVLFNKKSETIFFLQFFNEENKPVEAKYKLYKPKREKEGIFSSHFEIGRFLKEKKLIDEVKNTSQYINGGPVEIIEKNIEERYIIIDIKQRIISQ